MVFSLTSKGDTEHTWYKQTVVPLAATVLAITTLYTIGLAITIPTTQYVYAQGSLIGDVNIPVNVDITAIVPININIQNAQICVQVAGGSVLR